VPLALSSTIQEKDLPVFLQTHSKARVNPPSGSPTAVLPVRLHNHHLDSLRMDHETTLEHDDSAVCHCPVDRKGNAHHEDVCIQSASASTHYQGSGVRDNESKCCWTFIQELHLNNKACCPVRNLVSNQQVMPTAPTPAVQQSCLPLSQQPTRSKSTYGPQLTVSLSHQQFLRVLGCRHLELRQNDEAYGAVRTLVSDRQVALTVPSLQYQQGTHLISNHLHVQKCASNPQTAPKRLYRRSTRDSLKSHLFLVLTVPRWVMGP
jgi:hypothetical protein